jgi:hypothetical protein
MRVFSTSGVRLSSFVFVPTCLCAAREIPRLAGANASLRDDACKLSLFISRPYGTRFAFATHPGLPSWAFLFRPIGLAFRRPRQFGNPRFVMCGARRQSVAEPGLPSWAFVFRPIGLAFHRPREFGNPPLGHVRCARSICAADPGLPSSAFVFRPIGLD